MINIKEDVKNEAVKLKINNLCALTTKAIRSAFYNIGKDLVSSARKYIDEKPKHGRTYKVYLGRGGKRLKRRRDHVASAPGEAPAVVTGALRASVDFVVKGTNELEFGTHAPESGRHGQGVGYGKFLEYGNLLSMSGQGSKNIAPRPFISRSYQSNKQNILKHFEDAISRGLK